MILLLSLLSCGGRLYVYYEMVRQGIRDKTYCMPLFALGLNFSWDLVYAVEGLICVQIQTIACIAGFILNGGIVYTYFKYGRERIPGRLQQKFIPMSIAVFLLCFIFQIAFYLQFDAHPAAQYSRFLQDAVTSVLFIYMFYTRSDLRGQSVVIAAVKCAATFLSVIQQGYLEIINPFVLVCGAVCLAADAYYIVLVAAAGKKTAALFS